MAADSLTLLMATRNAHKAAEIRAILGAGYRYATLNDYPNAPTIAEDAATFAGNAAKKALELARFLAGNPPPLPPPASSLAGVASKAQAASAYVLADDSGLEVDALGGAPGVQSARFAAIDGAKAGNSPDRENNAKLLRLLKEVPAARRTARFRCVLALVPVIQTRLGNRSPVCAADESGLQAELFEGSCEGQILFAPRGSGGFGYDPLFVPDGFEEAFAELGEEAKNRLSHRAKALEKLKQRLEVLPRGSGNS